MRREREAIVTGTKAGAGARGALRFADALASAFLMIRAQKLKSFFSLLGIVIGVTSLVAVISIVAGMDRYVREDFANRIFGVNTFTLQRRSSVVFSRPDDETIREWRRRPRLRVEDYRHLKERIETPLILPDPALHCQTEQPGSPPGRWPMPNWLPRHWWVLCSCQVGR